MRIPSNTDPNGPDRAARADRAKTDKAKRADKSEGRPEASDRVARKGVKATVSAKARSLAKEKGLDVAKVNRLRELIDNGSFFIDVHLIAQRIVEQGG